ncbi:DNA-directed RNA polymerase, mitochondrial [Cytospora mali]|uniref:DNA-directed RNA polymerase n=1 Tax=Cytospora mali TaxID=578113 RepID=A0A194UWG8_CYTMA|nr:DNA-directed RNA polymerase, mitochondrial [Valsa mali var. pyri (nom. inval.)]
MFVRTNISRQNLRLGRSVTRLAKSSECRSGLGSQPSCLPATRSLLFTRQQSRPWRKSPVGPMSHLHERHLATAVDDAAAIPDSGARVYDLKTFDPSMTMVLKEPARPPPAQRTSINGIPGDMETALTVFDACLRVGKLDRGAMVLQRVENLGHASPELLIDMNNRYLDAWINQIRADPGLGKAEDLHAWYELHIFGAELPQTPETVAYMLKASLLTTPDTGKIDGSSRLERLIRRYMGMLPPEKGLDVLYCTDILDDSDIATITKFYPEYNITYEEDEDFPIPEDTVATGPSTNASEVSDDTGPLPDVLSTPQKGMGLQSIKNTLEIFRRMRDGYDISKLPMAERLEFQSRLERDCIDVAVERWREEHESLRKLGLSASLNAPSLNAKLWQWHQDLEARIKKEFEAIEASEKNPKKMALDFDRCIYGPVLMQSSPARLAAVTIMSTISSLAFQGADKGVLTSNLLNHISRIVEEDIRTNLRQEQVKVETRKAKQQRSLKRQRKLSKVAEPVSEPVAEPISEPVAEPISEPVSDPSADSFADPFAITDAALAKYDAVSEHDASDYGSPKSIRLESEDKVKPWPIALKMKIAANLLSSLADVFKVTVVREHPVTKEKMTSEQPALTHTTQFKRGRRVGMILPHPVLAEMLREEPRGDFLARHLPMVVTPQSWTAFDKGAYHESPVPLVRIKAGEKDQRLYAEAALARGDMDQVTKGLDVLGKTAWRINRPVLSIFLEAWNSGEQLANIPALHPAIPIPPEPEASTDPLVRRNWIKEIKTAQNLKSSYHSLRCFMNFQLEIARAYRDQEFFFPHNIDFRGRAYPIPPYLNHMGADHVRGLLRFSEGRELGERGLMWLKVHLSNVFGFDKASLKDRESFAMEHIEDIYDSASNPLTGKRWWLEAEDPWQCLAACFELKAALDSPDPTKFVSHLPVHQDGTCNGLQHYAALGGDSWGARQVNLEPGDKPADVYSAVAELVIKDLEVDMEQGNPMAKIMYGKIKRKVVKQTVMTNVYGVTFAGAKKQVLKQLDALYPNIGKESGIDAGLLASYVTTKIFKALSTMFRGAHDIQYWLGEIGGRVCRALTAEQLDKLESQKVEPNTKATKSKKPSKNSFTSEDLLTMMRTTIIWTTPLRMPIVQPYRKTTSKIISTPIQSLVLNNPDRFDPVNRRKQLQAFPPNFIHSLDASHMLLSALECNELGLSFAAVHDSFWTHAADVDVMNRVLRDAFIRIHSEDVIKRLLQEFEARYRGGLYLAHLDSTSAAAKAIKSWRKFRETGKKSAQAELLLEKKRMQLLNSKVESEREEGRKMVTPASIYEDMSSEVDVVKEDMGGTTLGSMSVTTTKDAEGDEDGGEAAGEGGDEMSEEHAVDPDAGPEEPQPDYAAMYTNVSHFQEKLAPPKSVKSKTKTIPVWLPLTFPDMPQRGDFDVTKLRQSEYFFS